MSDSTKKPTASTATAGGSTAPKSTEAPKVDTSKKPEATPNTHKGGESGGFVKTFTSKLSDMSAEVLAVGVIAVLALFMSFGNTAKISTLSENDQVLRSDTVKLGQASNEVVKGVNIVSKNTDELDTRTKTINTRLDALDKKVEKAMKSADTLQKIKSALEESAE